MSERFQRFDPKTMNPYLYLGNEIARPENFDLRVISVLNGAFSPIIETFDKEVRATLAEDMNATIPLAGKTPTVNRYRLTYEPSRRDELYPKLDLIPYADYLYSHQEGGSSILSLYSPVGEYGLDFALTQIQAGRLLYTFVARELPTICHETRERYRRILDDETYQRLPLDTFKEGIQTTVNMLAVLTAQKVAGYEDPVALCRQLVEDDIVNFFAANSANAQVFPLVRDGYHFDTPVVSVDGHLKVRDEIAHGVIEERQRFLKRSPHPSARGRGCPVAHKTIAVDAEGNKDSGVNILSRLYVDTLEYYTKNEARRKEKIFDVFGNSLET